jgi:hypothetical protein
MIGGGEYKSFQAGSIIDQELVVRSAQCHALMPMMQFSVAPWRILDGPHLQAVRKAVRIRQEHKDRNLTLARQSACTGEPIVCSMEYVFRTRDMSGSMTSSFWGPRFLWRPSWKRAPGIAKSFCRKEHGRVLMANDTPVPPEFSLPSRWTICVILKMWIDAPPGSAYPSRAVD